MLTKLQKSLQQEARDRTILASIGESLVVTDTRGRIVMVNKAFEETLGWTAQDAKGKLITTVIPSVNEKGKTMPLKNRAIIRVLKTQKKFSSITMRTHYYVRKDGTRIPVDATVTPIVVKGKLTGAVEVFRDISQEKEISRMEAEFITIASHQLRTPLTAIQWVAARLDKKENLSSKGKRYLNDIRSSSSRLAQLVDMLLNVSRIEGGRLGITPQSVDVVSFVSNYLHECRPLCVKKKIKLSFTHPKKISAKSDLSALRNIVQSLVSNAIEYTKKGGRVEIALEKNVKDFFLTVSDTGIGIPRNEQKTIFDKFRRGSNAQLLKTDGTGLGLYIAKQATELLGGSIRFESQKDKGTTFFITLPLRSKSKKGERAFAS